MANQDRIPGGKTNDLDAVMAAFSALPTEQLVAESLILANDSESGLRLAGAAVFGFSRSGQYIDTARGLIDQILANADQISWHMDGYSVIFDRLREDYDASPLAERELEKAASHEEGAKALSLRSEIHWHLYAECLHRAWYYMRNSRMYFDPDFAVKPTQQNYIEIVRAFRNHMTHRDKAVSVSDSADWRSMSRSAEGWHHIGYRRDRMNRIEFSPVDGPFKGRTVKMPMNEEGFRRFKNIIADTYEDLRRSCLDRLRRQFTHHPETMPAVDQVGTLSRDVLELVEE